MTSPVGATSPDSRPLGWPGRIAVIALVVPALLVGLTSGYGVLAVAPYGFVGVFLAIRRPRNSVGWLLLALGWAFGFAFVIVPTAAAQQLLGGAAPPAVMALAVLLNLGGGSIIPLLLVIAIVFPSGRLPTGRWGRLARAALTLVVLLLVLSVFSPTISVTPVGSESAINVPNPLAVVPGWPPWSFVSASTPIIYGLTVAGVISMFLRFGRARGVERAQLRWLVWSMAFIFVGFIVGLVGDGIFVNGLGGLVWIPAEIAFPLPAIAVGAAVLRYKLYEIDRVISRTISWAVVTLILGGLFVALILALQALLAPVTQSNELAVAGSTLLVFALFQPLRRRVQRLVDRRFNRSRYDAERTVAAFAERLRDEVDLEQLRAEILATVAATVEPTSVSLWLRN
jgi:hypothetical protein